MRYADIGHGPALSIAAASTPKRVRLRLGARVGLPQWHIGSPPGTEARSWMRPAAARSRAPRVSSTTRHCPNSIYNFFRHGTQTGHMFCATTGKLTREWPPERNQPRAPNNLRPKSLAPVERARSSDPSRANRNAPSRRSQRKSQSSRRSKMTHRGARQRSMSPVSWTNRPRVSSRVWRAKRHWRGYCALNQQNSLAGIGVAPLAP